jgi:hypothetical protein
MPAANDTPRTVGDICDADYVVLDHGAAAARNLLSPGQVGLVSSDGGRLPIGVVSFEVLQRLGGQSRETGHELTTAAEPVLLVTGDLPLDRAFRILLAHPELHWVAVAASGQGQPIQGLIRRGQLVPSRLERFQGTAMDRVGLPGDPILPASGLSYRCPEDPDGHVFTAVQIETWTPELRARCPVDGALMTPYVAAARDSRGS